MRIRIKDERAMLDLGARIAAAIGERGALVFLSGDLGAGKTTLVRGFLRALGHAGAVKSPTYTLVEPYRLAGRDIFHFDLYRLVDPEEIEAAGLREHFTPEAVCLVEWPEKGGSALPVPDLHIHLSHAPAGREAEIRAESLRGKMLLDAIPNGHGAGGTPNDESRAMSAPHPGPLPKGEGAL